MVVRSDESWLSWNRVIIFRRLRWLLHALYELRAELARGNGPSLRRLHERLQR